MLIVFDHNTPLLFLPSPSAAGGNSGQASTAAGAAAGLATTAAGGRYVDIG